MKKLLTVLMVGVFFVAGFQQAGECQPRQNLYSVLEDAKVVNVYIGDITDSSGQAGDMIPGFRKALENELKTRQTINFVTVEKEDDADIIISCDINERIWLANDPIDQIHGLGAIAADAAINENYARMQADFIVKKGPRKMVFRNIGRLFKRRNTLFDEELQATITQGNMPEEESKPLLEKRMAEVFMRKCFAKNAKM